VESANEKKAAKKARQKERKVIIQLNILATFSVSVILPRNLVGGGEFIILWIFSKKRILPCVMIRII